LKYKVIIIDDNRVIRDAIVRLIDWEVLGCTVVSDASNGIEGEKKVMELKPDIIITDIKMPGFNGLEMARRIAPLLPGTKFIVITGYQNFDYAQSAIKIGVCDFILKPIKMTELFKSLKNVVVELERENSTALKIQEMSKENLDLYTQLNETLLSARREPGSSSPKERDPSANKGHSLLIRSVIEYIHGNYGSELSLNTLAKKFWVNPSYLSALIKKETGENFIDLLTKIRLEEAKKLLKDPRLKINEVSQMVGYSDYTYFYQVFKKHESISPKEYKEAE
jgi:two-component system response regulator YesN